MTTSFAFECYADRDVFLFLRNEVGLPLQPVHSRNQGEVINDLLIRQKASVGLVDEDPLSTHHRLRDQMKVLTEDMDLGLRKMSDRYLIVVKPDLEECFFQNMERLNLKTALAEGSRDLHRLLGLPSSKKHEHFRQELSKLYKESRGRKVPTFLSKLEEMLRAILSPNPP